ncbi:hypothetical protein K1T71_008100 [Dendrolimus kikuchii]|uniref:Uncharacterized protein n=1 Tax=Dendrolimus kikuchii TaxID=765133 RepID=A0ACC1CWG4_9NEOP|nr:hypothetical protein K1T71_008100 [Dendrolimus kikuchii]
MGCGEFLVKYILFFANLAFALAGLALMGLGIAVQFQLSPITVITDSFNFEVAPITAMVLGAVVFLVSFFGCCGAIRESNCMLVTFSCCGPTGPAAYLNPLLPESCCATSPCTIVNSYSGCNGVIQEFLNTFGLAIGIVAIIIVAIELVAVVFGLCLANHVRNKSRRGRY